MLNNAKVALHGFYNMSFMKQYEANFLKKTLATFQRSFLVCFTYIKYA
jgi:hypothetical protein